MRGEKEGETVLKNFLGQVIATATTETITPQKDLAQIVAEVEMVRERVALLASSTEEVGEVKGEVAGKSIEYQEMLKKPNPPEPLGAVIYESYKKEGFVKRIWDFFASLFD